MPSILKNWISVLFHTSINSLLKLVLVKQDYTFRVELKNGISLFVRTGSHDLGDLLEVYGLSVYLPDELKNLLKNHISC